MCPYISFSVRSALAKSAKDMMEMIMKMEAKKEMTVILLLWLWWDECNKLREGRTASEIAYVTVAAAALTDRFQTNTQPSLLSDFRQAQCWKRLRQGGLKINSDGAFDPHTRSGGWGFVIRDEQGLMILAGLEKQHSCSTPSMQNCSVAWRQSKQRLNWGSTELFWGKMLL